VTCDVSSDPPLRASPTKRRKRASVDAAGFVVAVAGASACAMLTSDSNMTIARVTDRLVMCDFSHSLATARAPRYLCGPKRLSRVLLYAEEFARR
jgi:hypothetical protein